MIFNIVIAIIIYKVIAFIFDLIVYVFMHWDEYEEKWENEYKPKDFNKRLRKILGDQKEKEN